MPRASDPLAGARLILWAAVLASLLFLAWPWIQDTLIGFQAEPRAVTARGALAEEEKTTIAIFEKVSPSVVYITTVQHVRDYWTRNVMRVPKGTGSGFIWDNQGHVVTNYHVVKGAQEAQVRLSDHRSYPAVLVGASPDHDLAVLRINVAFDRPPPVPVGTSGDLSVGQMTFAIGNPFGLDHTLTTGVVSALDRSIENEVGGVIEHLIQTDAAINPGNSGGPLIDSAGRLIGINTAIYSTSGEAAGIGFAIPVDTVNRVVPKLIAYGKYVRPGLGIAVDDEINRKVLAGLGIQGVLVLQVSPGSSAEQAGLRETRVTESGDLVLGDVIQTLDGQPVTDLSELLDLLERHHVGDTVTLGIWRNRRQVELQVLLNAG